MTKVKLNATIDELMPAGIAGEGRPRTTGRYLALFREDAVEDGIRFLADSAGLKVASTADFEDGVVDEAGLAGADAHVQHNLGTAVLAVEAGQLDALRRDAGSPILAVEPERMVYTQEHGELAADTGVAHRGVLSVSYLEGYRDAVTSLYERVATNGRTTVEATVTRRGRETIATWGLEATRTTESPWTGAGIRVAVLDTGFDASHPDFAGRTVTERSFIPKECGDGHGHGTHCIGTACGPQSPGAPPRYGVAFGAEIFAGKVLADRGSGPDQGILAGLEWAVRNRCQIVSMSLGAPTDADDAPSRVFENVARRALRAGTLIIAAAGNDSDRDLGLPPRPVAHPANCPSVMAVAAIDRDMLIADFSNRGLNPDGGQVDIAGPGVAVRSSWILPRRYRTIDGTSMATPHVAGIAALYAEAQPGLAGAALWAALVQNARRLDLPSTDVGAGLVQAPVER